MIQTQINGKTKVFAVIGDPISHTFSPVIHNTIAKYTGDNMAYVPFHIKGDNLKSGISGAHALGIQGINVTIPHKKAVAELTASLDSTAKSVGSVNTLKYTREGYVGYNTDVPGLARVFKVRGIPVKDKTVAILGAGGSSCAAAAMAAQEKAKEIFIVNRTENNAITVAQHIKYYFNTEIRVFSYDEFFRRKTKNDIIIQTTSAGFGEQEHLSPITDDDFLHCADVALDIIYKPWETVFLKQAKNCGCTCINGFDMLVYQAIASYEIWYDTNFDNEFVEKIKNEMEAYYNKV